MVVVADTELLVLGNPNYYDPTTYRRYLCGLLWPHESDSVEKASITRIVEYLDGSERIHFFNELHRVMKPGGRATIYVPYWSSQNAYADPYVAWPPITELSFQYLVNAEFRRRNGLNYPGITTDFHITGGHSFDPEQHVRSDMTRADRLKHNINISVQYVCTLTKAESNKPES